MSEIKVEFEGNTFVFTGTSCSDTWFLCLNEGDNDDVKNEELKKVLFKLLEFLENKQEVY